MCIRDRPEIVRAAQSLAAKVAAGEMKPEDITEEALSAQMYTCLLYTSPDDRYRAEYCPM